MHSAPDSLIVVAAKNQKAPSSHLVLAENEEKKLSSIIGKFCSLRIRIEILSQVGLLLNFQETFLTFDESPRLHF